MYRKTKNLLKAITSYGLIVFTVVCIITGLMTFCWGNSELPHLEPYTVAIMGGGIALFLYTLLQFHRKLCRSCSKRTALLMRAVTVVSILAIQIICFAKTGEITLTSDSFIVTDMASDMVANTQGILDNSSDNITMANYFARYENNHFFIILLYKYFCILNNFIPLNIGNFITAVQVLNIIMLDLGILLAYLAARKMKDVETADTLLLLSALSPTTYVWIFWSYTNTYSIPFVMGILFMYLYLHDTQSTKGTIFYGISMGILGIVGCFIRPTTIIPIIAVLCMQILCRDNINKTTIKRTVLWTAIFFLTAVLTASLFTEVRKSHLTDPEGQGKFPITHWLMMGLSDEGGFNKEDLYYTLQFKTKEEKNKADICKIKERISEKGAIGLVSLAMKKLWRPYGEGTDQFTQQASFAGKTTPLYDYVYGKKNGLFLIYCKAFRLLTLSLVLLSIISFIRRKQKDDMMLYMLTLFGSMLFFVLWESNRKYGVSFQYVLLSLSAGAITGSFSLSKESYICKKASILLYGSCIVVTLFALFLGYYNCVVNQYDYKKEIIKIKPRSRIINNIIAEDKIVEQTFVANQPFDEIKLYVKEYNQSQNMEASSYRIDILNSRGQKETASQIVSKNTAIKHRMLKLKLGNICPEGKEEQFTIRITGNSGTKDFLEFSMLGYQHEDKFRSGKLKENEQELKADIGMRILGKRTESLMPGWIYLTVGGIIILLESTFFITEIKKWLLTQKDRKSYIGQLKKKKEWRKSLFERTD